MTMKQKAKESNKFHQKLSEIKAKRVKKNAAFSRGVNSGKKHLMKRKG